MKTWAVVLGTELMENGFVKRLWLADVFEWEDKSWADHTAADRNALSRMSGDRNINYAVVQWFGDSPPCTVTEYGTSVLD